ILSGSFALAEGASAFTESMSQAATFAGASAGEIEALHAAAFDANGALLGFNSTAKAGALAILTKESGSAKDAIAELTPSLTLAGLAGMDADQAATMLSRTLKEFRVGADGAQATVDKLALSQRLFHVGAGDMAGALRRVASGATLAGASMEDAMI